MDNKKLIPNLRFPEFNNPWEEKKLGEISQKVAYGMNASAIKFDGINKYLRITDIDESSRKFIPKPLSSPNDKIEDKFILKKGDIVFARTGASVGKSYLYNENDGKLLYAGFLIKFNINNAIPYFVFLQSFRESYRKWVQVYSMRSGQPGLNAEEYKLFKLNFPELSEQKKIASFLTDVDSKLTQLTKKKALLENYKKGVMQKIFNQKIRFKDNKGNNYPKWEEKTLGELFKVSAGGDIKKINVSKEKTEDFKFPIFANSEKKEGLYGYSNIYKIDFECITVTGRGSLGNAIARYKKFYPIVRLLVLKPKIKLNVFFFENIINQLNILSESTGVPQLTAPQVSKYKLNSPCLEEQEKIANFLSEIDIKIKTLNTKIENNKGFKKGLLQKMFV
ncbi:restriction endonuclease subunit S [Tenacibaculum dicentrarchi]|uniref:restriction endonuclease subunit S n=1 Tax=Tenacibaculum dicentrarchi TaxID=669041 RepID=UPI000CB716BC|nr:conserved hypothetical protein [Tenacibaculum dicentrarchi]